MIKEIFDNEKLLLKIKLQCFEQLLFNLINYFDVSFVILLTPCSLIYLNLLCKNDYLILFIVH